VIIALSEHNAILPLSGITRERKEQPEAENTCDSSLCLLYKVQGTRVIHEQIFLLQRRYKMYSLKMEVSR